jgi:hypothetical protein
VAFDAFQAHPNAANIVPNATNIVLDDLHAFLEPGYIGLDDAKVRARGGKRELHFVLPGLQPGHSGLKLIEPSVCLALPFQKLFKLRADKFQAYPFGHDIPFVSIREFGACPAK